MHSHRNSQSLLADLGLDVSFHQEALRPHQSASVQQGVEQRSRVNSSCCDLIWFVGQYFRQACGRLLCSQCPLPMLVHCAGMRAGVAQRRRSKMNRTGSMIEAPHCVHEKNQASAMTMAHCYMTQVEAVSSSVYSAQKEVCSVWKPVQLQLPLNSVHRAGGKLSDRRRICRQFEIHEGRKESLQHPWQPTRLNGWNSVCLPSA